jgi:hypothetical protein
MAEFEVQHPLGQDIEKIHGAMMSGFEAHKDLLHDKADFIFVDALTAGNGVSSVVMANWTTRNQLLVQRMAYMRVRYMINMLKWSESKVA